MTPYKEALERRIIERQYNAEMLQAIEELTQIKPPQELYLVATLNGMR